MSNFLNKSFFKNFLIILSIFALDRFSKIYVIFQNEKSLSAELFESKYLNINLIWNDGIAFGLLSFNGPDTNFRSCLLNKGFLDATSAIIKGLQG